MLDRKEEIFHYVELKQYHIWLADWYKLPHAAYGWLKKCKQIKRVVFNGNYKMLVVQD